MLQAIASLTQRLPPGFIAWPGLLLLLAAPFVPQGKWSWVVMGGLFFWAAMPLRRLRRANRWRLGTCGLLAAATLWGPFAHSLYCWPGYAASLAGLALWLRGMKTPPRGLGWVKGQGGILRLDEHWAGRAPAMLFFLAALVMFWACFGFQPSLVDATAQYIHAKYLAQGHLTGPAHPLKEFFPIWMVIHKESFFSQYQIGHVALIAVGHWLGSPWLIPPLLGAASVWMIYAIARRCDGETTARLAALMALICPFMLFMSATYMNHVSSLFFSCLHLLCYVCWVSAPSPRRRALLALGASLALGGLMLSRPITAIGIGLLPMAHIGLSSLKRWRIEWPSLAAIFLGLAFGLFLTLGYNALIVGSPFLFPTARYTNNDLIASLGHGGTFAPQRLFHKTADEWNTLNWQLTHWQAPPLLLYFFALAAPGLKLHTRIVLVSALSMGAANLTNGFMNNVFGPRYLYDTLPGIFLGMAMGLRRLGAHRGCGAVGIALLIEITTAQSMQLPAAARMYASRYFNNNPGFTARLTREVQKPALVFLGRPEKTEGYNPNGYGETLTFLETAFNYPYTDEDEVIFARDRGDEANKKLINFYSNRYVYTETKRKLTLKQLPTP